MGRLAGMRTYLCGAIDHASDYGAGWRDIITPELQRFGIVVFDPLRKPISVGLEGDANRLVRRELKQQQNYDMLSSLVKPIRNVDLRMVDITDFLIVYLDMEVTMCGTYEEISLANRQKKPILVVCEQGKSRIPDWMFAQIPHQTMFSTWKELLAYLSHINSDCLSKIDTLNRWYFFDQTKLYTNEVLNIISGVNS